MTGRRNEPARDRRRKNLKTKESLTSVTRSELLTESGGTKPQGQPTGHTIEDHFGWQVIQKTQVGDGDFPNLTQFHEKPNLSGKDFEKNTYVLYVENCEESCKRNDKVTGKNIDTALKGTQTTDSLVRGLCGPQSKKLHTAAKPAPPPEPAEDEACVKKCREAKEEICIKTCREEIDDRCKARCKDKDDGGQGHKNRDNLIKDFYYVPRDQRSSSVTPEGEAEADSKSRSRSRSKSKPKRKSRSKSKSKRKSRSDSMDSKDDSKSRSKSEPKSKSKSKSKSESKSKSRSKSKSKIKMTKPTKKSDKEPSDDLNNDDLLYKTVEEFEKEKVENLNRYLIGSKSEIPDRDKKVGKTKEEFEKEKEAYLKQMLKCSNKARSKSPKKKKRSKSEKKEKKSKGSESKSRPGEHESEEDECIIKCRRKVTVEEDHHEVESENPKAKEMCLAKCKEEEEEKCRRNCKYEAGDEEEDETKKKRGRSKSKDKGKGKHKKPGRWSLRAGAEKRDSYYGNGRHELGGNDAGDDIMEPGKSDKNDSLRFLRENVPSEILLETPSGNNQYLYVSGGKYSKLKASSQAD